MYTNGHFAVKELFVFLESTPRKTGSCSSSDNHVMVNLLTITVPEISTYDGCYNSPFFLGVLVFHKAFSSNFEDVPEKNRPCLGRAG